MANKNLKLTLAALFGGVAAVTTATALTLTSCNPQEKGLALHDVHDVKVNAGGVVSVQPKLYLDGNELTVVSPATVSYQLLQAEGTSYVGYTLDAATGLTFATNSGVLSGTANVALDYPEKVLAIKATYNTGLEGSEAQTVTATFKLEVVGLRAAMENISAVAGTAKDSSAPVVTYKGASVASGVGTLLYDIVDQAHSSKSLPDNVNFANATGVITVTNTATATPSDTYYLKVTLTLTGGTQVVAYAAFTLVITAPAT
ncbi:MAG: hypothetical protein LBC44_04525 [Mycoplasmataceae bacterium]|nr:hypothetical protein [Mycoplasmataceae bacterium]